MAHKVHITLPEREIGNSDVSFKVEKNGKPLGRLRLSKGGVDWIPAPGRTPIKKTWSQLDVLFTAGEGAGKKGVRKP